MGFIWCLQETDLSLYNIHWLALLMEAQCSLWGTDCLYVLCILCRFWLFVPPANRTDGWTNPGDLMTKRWYFQNVAAPRNEINLLFLSHFLQNCEEWQISSSFQVSDQLDAQLCYIIRLLLYSSTCFEQLCAYHQEVKLYEGKSLNNRNFIITFLQEYLQKLFVSYFST